MIGRGEHMEVRTLHRAAPCDHELSGNVIDLCPVGALVSKPYRFSARAWEMTSQPLISPHDARRHQPLRPRAARQADARRAARERSDQRDLDRRPRPLQLRRRLQRRPPDGARWCAQAASGGESTGRRRSKQRRRRPDSAHAAPSLGVLASPSSTVEELYLLDRIARALGPRQHRPPPAPARFPRPGRGSGCCRARHAHRGRRRRCECAARRSARTCAARCRCSRTACARRRARARRSRFVNPARFDVPVPGARTRCPRASRRWRSRGVLAAAAQAGEVGRRRTCAARRARAAERRAPRAGASAARAASSVRCWLGALAAASRRAIADLRALAAALAAADRRLARRARRRRQRGRRVSRRRGAASRGGGVRGRAAGLDAARDAASAAARPTCCSAASSPRSMRSARDGARTLARRELVVAITPFASESSAQSRTCCCRSGTFAETSGTYVNCERRVAELPRRRRSPLGEARPGWKVLRVLGNLLEPAGLRLPVVGGGAAPSCARRCAGAQPAPATAAGTSRRGQPAPAASRRGVLDVPMYQTMRWCAARRRCRRTREGRAPACTS